MAPVLLGVIGLLLGFLMGSKLTAFTNLQPYLVIMLLGVLAYAVEVLQEGGTTRFRPGPSVTRFLIGLLIAEVTVWLGAQFQLDLYLAPATAYLVLCFFYLYRLRFYSEPGRDDGKGNRTDGG